MSKRQTPKKRKMRTRHTGRLELHGTTFIGRWMVNGRRFSESSGIKVGDYGGDERKAREAAEDWLARKLAALRASDAVKKIDRDEASLRAQQEVVFAGAFKQLDERRATATDEVPPLKIADAFDRFLKSLDFDRATKPSTVRIMRQRFGRFAKWIGDNHAAVVLMREVTPAVAKQYAEDLNATVSAGVFNANIITINQVWNALSDEIKGANPWQGIKRQTQGQTYRRALTDAELDTIFNAANGDRDLTLLFSLMLFAGMRLGDAATVRWESIRFDRGVIDFNAIKTGARCKPPLVPALRQLLEQTPPTERTGYIIPKFAESYNDNPTPMSALVTGFFKQCGIETSVKVSGDERKHPAATAHSFRHTFISKCGNAGVPLAIVQGWVGHMSKDMTEHYFHDDDRATQLYAASIPQMTPAPIAIGNAAGDAQTVECESVQPEATDAAEVRYRRFCDALDGMTADELDRAADEIARRRANMI